jgi:hypothetical protein
MVDAARLFGDVIPFAYGVMNLLRSRFLLVYDPVSSFLPVLGITYLRCLL